MKQLKVIVKSVKIMPEKEQLNANEDVEWVDRRTPSDND